MSTTYPLLFYTILLFIIHFCSCSNCKYPSFVISSHDVHDGHVMDDVRVDDISDCSHLCVEKNCTGFNFIIDKENRAHCHIINKNHQVEPPPSSSSPPSTILCSAEQLCLTDSCSHRSFAFEKFPNRQSSSPETIISTEKCPLEKCLNNCLQNSDCRSIVYHKITSDCQLLTIGMHSVYNSRRSFVYDEDTDLYENNCRQVRMSETSCNFMRITSAGLPDLYDSIEKASSVSHCENLCINRYLHSDPCRSYTFDQSNGYCYLSQTTSRLKGRSALEVQNKNLSHGDLDDCIDLSLKCHADRLQIHGEAMKMFSGSMKTKLQKETLCLQTINSSFVFDVSFEFDKCGLNKKTSPYPSYNGLVHVKEGSTTLVTIRDKILQVECRIHTEQQLEMTVENRVGVMESNKTVLSNTVLLNPPAHKPKPPKFSLQVINSNGSPVSQIRIGQPSWVAIKINDQNSDDFMVTHLKALQVGNNSSKSLVDSQGCIDKQPIVDGILYYSKNEIRFRVHFNGFPKNAEVYFEAFIESCHSNCRPKCNDKFVVDSSNSSKIESKRVTVTRNRRSISTRQLELSQDIYKIHGSRLKVLPSKDAPFSSPEPSEETLVVQEAVDHSFVSSVNFCLFDDGTCLLTIVLGCVQLFLLTSCVVIIYCYVDQLRHIRAAEASMHPAGAPRLQTTLK